MHRSLLPISTLLFLVACDGGEAPTEDEVAESCSDDFIDQYDLALLDEQYVEVLEAAGNYGVEQPELEHGPNAAYPSLD